MALSGPLEVIEFQAPDTSTTVATSLIDISAAGADAATLIVPLPLLIHAFGVYVTEDMAASATGSVFLERATVVAGSDTTVVELDLDSTDLKSGDGTLPHQTASTGSEDIDAGDVIFAPASSFPVLITPPQTLTVRHVQTSSVAGELRAFIVAQWQGIDLRSTEVWGDAT
jgi:hypothetical protein